MKKFLLLSLAALGSLQAAPLDDLARYDYGDSRKPLLELQVTINQSDVATRAGLEKQFIALLGRNDVPTGAKDVICRWLQVIGTPASIPALEKITSDPKIGFLGVYALMSYPQPEATTALLGLLEKSPENLRDEIIGALGRRGASEAVPALARINNPAAWTALAAIASPEAVTALQKAPEDAAWPKLYGALRLLEKDPSAKALAVSVFHSLLQSPARVGAVDGLIRANEPDALAALRKLLLEGNLQAVSLTAPFAEELAPDFGQWSPQIQRAVLLAGNSVTMARKGLESKDDTVRVAAIRSLGSSQESGVIPLLLPLLIVEKDAPSAAQSLQRLPGTEVNAQLRADLNSPAQAALLLILAQRQDRETLEAAFSATQSDNEKVRAAGFQALALLAQPDDLPKFLGLLPTIKNPADRASWNKTLQVMVQNSSDPNGTAALLEGALGQATPEARPSLLTALATLESGKAKAALVNALHADDLEQRKAVIRILSGVRTISSADLLLGATREAKDPSERMLALRGYLDGLRTRTDLSPDQQFDAYQAALTLASEQSEKDAIYAGIKGIKNSRQATEFLKKKPSA